MAQKRSIKVSDMESMIQEMNYVAEITLRISERMSLDELLTEIMESSKILVNAEASSLLIYDPEDDLLYFEVATGDKGDAVSKFTTRMGEGIAGWVAQNRTPLLIEDCYKDPRFNKEFDKQSNFRTKSMICVPMIHKEKLIGVIQVINKKEGDVFTERDMKLFKILSAQCAISIENARLLEVQVQQEVLNRELKTAREIQQNLLPDKLPEFDDLDIAMTIIPARQIGGDYYNVYPISKDKTLFFICDVSGKSISAALIVSTIFSSIVTYFKLNVAFDLIGFVNCLNRVLIDSTTQEKFATCWFGLYDHPSKKLFSINAGHNAIYIVKEDGTVNTLNKGGFMLGFMDFDFQHEELQMEKNDVLFIYTDGVSEAMNENKELYGDERLIELLKANRKLSSAEILKAMLADIRKFVGEAEQSDDITGGVIKII